MPVIPALVHAATGLWSAASLYNEEPHCPITGRCVIHNVISITAKLLVNARSLIHAGGICSSTCSCCCCSCSSTFIRHKKTSPRLWAFCRQQSTVLQNGARLRKCNSAPIRVKSRFFSADYRNATWIPSASLNDSGRQMSSNPNPKLLGVYLDRTLSFGHHVEAVTRKASARCCVMSSLAGQSWVSKKFNLRRVYQTLIAPMMNYTLQLAGNRLWSSKSTISA